MKYIRTKEHIYKRLFIDRAIINECGYGTCDKELNPIGETIIKQADTIEELCDEFVIVDNADKRPYRINVEVYNERFYATDYSCLDYAIERFDKLKQFVGTKEKHDEDANYLYEENPNFVFDGNVCGAIWTDKGLIYVAKMNEKGELELL